MMDLGESLSVGGCSVQWRLTSPRGEALRVIQPNGDGRSPKHGALGEFIPPKIEVLAKVKVREKSKVHKLLPLAVGEKRINS
jgi:hypothetical protein